MIKNIKLYTWYYPIVILGYILTLVSKSVRPGLIATALLLVTGVMTLLDLKGNLFGIKDRLGTIDILALMYFVYCLLSGIWCTAYGMPLGVFTGDFSTGILTMVFYLVGRNVSEEDRTAFYFRFTLAVYAVGLVGFILFITAPQFYLDYLYDYHYISKADAATMRVRMISVIGSILVGYLSVAGMLTSAHILFDELKNRRNKFPVKGLLLFFAGLLFAFLSNQRSAMVVALLVLVYVNLLIFFTFKFIKLKYFWVETGLLLAGVTALCIVYFKAVLKVYYRLVSLPGAIGQRSDQWIGAINNMYNLWLGNGLGANGHRANGITEHLIADGGIAKLFVETGIIGFSIFIFMMILCFKYGCKKTGDEGSGLYIYAAETGIIAITLLQSIGSNILEFQLATPIFWFAVGVIAGNNRTYREDRNVS